MLTITSKTPVHITTVCDDCGKPIVGPDPFWITKCPQLGNLQTWHIACAPPSGRRKIKATAASFLRAIKITPAPAGPDRGPLPVGDRPSEFIDTAAAAGLMGLQEYTLRRWRHDGGNGLRYYKIGNSVRYSVDDVHRFMTANPSDLRDAPRPAQPGTLRQRNESQRPAAAQGSCQFMTTPEAAAYTGFAEMTLRKWRSMGDGRGPKFLKIRNAVRYRVEDLQAFLERSQRG